MTVRRVLLVLAGCVLVAGVLLLATPVYTEDATSGRIDCGSVLSPDVSGPSADAGSEEVSIFRQLRSECQDAIQGRQVVAWSVAGLGVLGLVLVAVVPAARRRVSVSQSQNLQQ